MATKLQPLTFADFEQELGVPYMAPFLKFALGDQTRAVRLHAWNNNVGAAFHRPLELVEVAIRNRIDKALTVEFGTHWWHAPKFLAQASQVTIAALDEASKHAEAKGRDGHADVVAEITFGAWVAILRPRYFDLIWRHHASQVFPGHRRLPFRSIAQTIDGLLKLRNAIGHHEPLLDLDLRGLHEDLLTVLGWMSPMMQAQASATSFVPKVLAGRP
ncbi:hypothetical protein [Sphingomonas sp. Leaf25]|uniref:hypothetical protein n=1 Tax=Sphingomonas sp. Leaf25 TaxID=1735692 RepID=UPI0006F2D5D1|nr:hypothetical protein [Sphingomonas sp. Leaf25]KQM98017.1 hypothetical protein ASE78_07020 [Sphingomonas sp. Leaf25]